VDLRFDGCAVLGAGGGVGCRVGFVGGDSVGRMDFETVGREERKKERRPLRKAAATTEFRRW
jgi:hypothetical protein